ncbi:MAG: RNA polymerase sporulation sigma factor SigK [Clostridiales bacterium]|nr:RNA polymerase sporulation sigma factor SigK [Clostridiales bacterium]
MLSLLTMLMLQGHLFTLRLTSTGSFPRPLKETEEREYLRRAAEGDMEARNKLVEHNLRLVAHIAKKYFAQSGDVDDLISIGTIGLIKAVNTYQPGRQIKLATYAARCIENEILMHLRKTRRLAGEVSLSEALENDDSANALSLMDVIRVEDNMLDDLAVRDACLRVRASVDGVLTDRERTVIVQRYGLDGRPPRTQREVAKECGISRSYVSRIEKQALAKLRSALEGPQER